MADAQPRDDSAGPDSAEDRYRAGELIVDKYQLVERLGRGGMGEVWRAHNRALDSRVAIKLISADVAADEAAKKTLVERLLEEARSTAQLDHPAIVKVFDFGRTRRGDPMIVMELLEGEDLATALDTHGTPNPLRAVRLLLPVIHGLAAVHDKGVVHRDIKPDNIFLCKKEGGLVQPKLVDFGIAKRSGRQTNRLTIAGTVMGSPDYMAPEQAQGFGATPQSDVWSICAVLYELISGSVPFTGPSVAAQLHAIVQKEPPPLSGFEGDADLWKIMRRAFEKKPEDRQPGMRELGRELASWALDQGARDDVTGVSLEVTWLGVAPSDSHAFLSERPASTRKVADSWQGDPSRDPSPRGSQVSAPEADSELTVLADIYKGGDPVQIMKREARRKIIAAVVVVASFGVLVVLVVLWGTGLLKP